jgi:hypothetical protein
MAGVAISPWGWQTGDCPGGGNRGRNRFRLRLRYRLMTEPSFDANDTAMGFWNRKRLRLRFGKRLRSRLRLRSKARFRSRRKCRRRSRQSSSYVQTNSEFYFEKYNARSEREIPNPKLQIPSRELELRGGRVTRGELRVTNSPFGGNGREVDCRGASATLDR